MFINIQGTYINFLLRINYTFLHNSFLVFIYVGINESRCQIAVKFELYELKKKRI